MYPFVYVTIRLTDECHASHRRQSENAITAFQRAASVYTSVFGPEDERTVTALEAERKVKEPTEGKSKAAAASGKGAAMTRKAKPVA